MDLDIDKRFDKLEQKMDVCIREIASLKVKSSIWGAVGGFLAALVPVVIGVGMWMMKNQ